MHQHQALETIFSHSKKPARFLQGCTAGFGTINLEILHTDFLTKVRSAAALLRLFLNALCNNCCQKKKKKTNLFSHP